MIQLKCIYTQLSQYAAVNNNRRSKRCIIHICASQTNDKNSQSLERASVLFSAVFYSHYTDHKVNASCFINIRLHSIRAIVSQYVLFKMSATKGTEHMCSKMYVWALYTVPVCPAFRQQQCIRQCVNVVILLRTGSKDHFRRVSPTSEADIEKAGACGWIWSCCHSLITSYAVRVEVEIGRVTGIKAA